MDSTLFHTCSVPLHYPYLVQTRLAIIVHLGKIRLCYHADCQRHKKDSVISLGVSKAECNRTEHSGTQIYFTLHSECQNSSIFIGDLSISTVCSPLHSKLFLSGYWTAISMQLPRLGLAFNPISNKEKSIYPVKCKPGEWWDIPSANSCADRRGYSCSVSPWRWGWCACSPSQHSQKWAVLARPL